MNKLIAMGIMMAFGIGGGIFYSPFIPVAMYYLFAVWRPQFMWKYDLISYAPDFPWSFYMAITAMGSAFIWRMGFWLSPNRFAHVRLPQLNFGHYAFFFFAFWITLTYFNAENQLIAAECYDEYKKIFIVFITASLVITSIRQAAILAGLATFALVYIAFEVNVNYLKGYMVLVRNGWDGLDNNGAALLLATGVPLCIFGWDMLKHWSRWLVIMGVPLLVHAVLTSYSRGAMLSILVSTPIYILLCRKENRKWIGLGYLIGAISLPFVVGEEIAKRFSSINDYKQDESAESRLTTWSIAAKMAIERPILGYGVRNSSLYTREMGADMEGRVIHNTYLQIAADSGIVGVSAYLVCIIFAIVISLRIRSVLKPYLNTGAQEAEFGYGVANMVIGGLIVYCFGAFFLSLETVEIQYILWLIAFQTWSITQRHLENLHYARSLLESYRT